jgi:ferredoxin
MQEKHNKDDDANRVRKDKGQTEKELLRRFAREFPRTQDGYANRMHGYFYLKHLPLYIYHMKLKMNNYVENPEPPVRVGGEASFWDEEAVKMAVDHSNIMASGLDTNGYHAKVLRPEDAKKFYTVKQAVDLPDLPKTILPFERARRLVLNGKEEFAVTNCHCREIRGEKSCRPLDTCLMYGEPWIGFFEYHNPDSGFRRITKEEALRIIDESHALGRVQSAFFKDACGDRFYGICNCCKCCCVALMAHNYAKAPLFSASGYLRKVDSVKCKNCGTCVELCPFNIPKMEDGEMHSEELSCMGCTVCVDKCPHGALSLVSDDPARNEPLDLDVAVLDTQQKR